MHLKTIKKVNQPLKGHFMSTLPYYQSLLNRVMLGIWASLSK